jgi:hypothetical protein
MVTEPGASIQSVGGGVDVGKMRAAAEGMGLAHLRLKQGLLAAADGVGLTAGGAKVTPLRPKWWPDIWGHEEDT